MQVTHAQDHVTHAVIAQHDTLSFGISDSPEFFQILSSTLYTNQRLAVVREVLCNAWDAHIAAGCTDKPIIIELGRNLVIRDFGPGIPHDMIGEIYGTYGNSTKKNDGQQTGGFGLGCKAPFAYTDHFEVISHHGGTKTIYSISKSSAERNGKPGITPIVSLPTTETGLQVTIPIQHSHHYYFEQLIHTVVRNGEILAELNKTPLPTLPFSKMQGIWLITKELVNEGHYIYVRYGNVIYPIPFHQSYRNDYNAIQSLLIKLHSHTRPCPALVLQAAPHSISVTPSREAISLQDKTIGTIQVLLASFLDMVNKGMAQNYMAVIENQIAIVIAAENYGPLFDPIKKTPRISENRPQSRNAPITTLYELALEYLKYNYPAGHEFHHKDLKHRLNTAIQLKLGKRGHIEELRTILDARSPPCYAYGWFLRRLAGPLLARMMNHPVMDPKRMFIYDANHTTRNQHNLVPIKSYNMHSPVYYIPLLRNIMILAYSRVNLTIRAREHPVFAKYGHIYGSYVYVAPLLKNKIQEMRDFFTKQEYILVDLTIPQPGDTPNPVRVKRKKAPKLTGYPSLAGCITPGKSIRVDNCFLNGAPRVDNPKCFVPVVYSRAESRPLVFEHCNGSAAVQLIHLYGTDCAVVRTDKAEKELIDANVPRLRDYMAQDVVTQLTTSSKILSYWKESIEVALGNKGQLQSTHHQELATLLEFPEVRDALGLKIRLTIKEKGLLNLWQHLMNIRDRFPADLLVPVDDLIKSVKLSPVMLDIKKSSQSGSLVGLLNFAKIKEELKSRLTKPDKYKERIGLLLKTALIN